MLIRWSCAPQLRRRLVSSSALGARKRSSPRWGFRDWEFDREWFRTSKDLQQSECLRPGAVLTAMPYAYLRDGGGDHDVVDSIEALSGSARKFSSFESHEAWWDYILECQRAGKPQCFNEVLEFSSPRCLYFDLDGPPCYTGSHNFIMELLQKFVRSFFLGDALGWPSVDPQAVVLQSHQDEKYSCHVMFPQIQFDDYKHQNEYMPWMLRALGEMVVDVEGGQERLLQTLVDRAPYRSFQLLRGPFACKMKNKEVMLSSGFEPEDYFQNDALTCFAGYVEKDYALDLPSMSEILESNKALLESQYEEESCWHKDKSQLYSEHFQQRRPGDAMTATLDLAGLTELERYEVLLQHLGYERADDWSSWFYACGVTCSMLRTYNYSEEALERIWRAHCRWASQSLKFDDTENWQRITEADRADHLPGLRGLTRLVEHDHPFMQVRDKLWPFQMPKRNVESRHLSQ